MGQHVLLEEKCANGWDTGATIAHVPLMPLTLRIDDATVEEIVRQVAILVSVPTHPAEWMTPDEVADYLRCEKRRVYDLRSKGRLRGFKESGRLLFKRSDVEDLIEEDS